MTELPDRLTTSDDVRLVQAMVFTHLAQSENPVVRSLSGFQPFPAQPPDAAVAYGAPPPVMVTSVPDSGELVTVASRPAAGVPHIITEGDQADLLRQPLRPFPGDAPSRIRWPQPLWDRTGQMVMPPDAAGTVQLAMHAFLARASADATRAFADSAPMRQAKAYRREADELQLHADTAELFIPDLAASWWPQTREELLAAPRKPPPPPDTRRPSWH